MVYFESHRHLCQSEENKCTWTHNKCGAIWQFQVRATRVGEEQEEGGVEEMEGKIDRKLSEVNSWAVSRGQNKLIY